MSTAFHSTFVALLVSEPNQRDFHVLAVTPDANVIPRLTRDSTLVGLVRVLGKPIDFSSSPALLDDELPAEDAAAIRAAQIDLVAPIVTAGAHQREALLVLGTEALRRAVRPRRSRAGDFGGGEPRPVAGAAAGRRRAR